MDVREIKSGDILCERLNNNNIVELFEVKEVKKEVVSSLRGSAMRMIAGVPEAYIDYSHLVSRVRLPTKKELEVYQRFSGV